MGLIVRESTAPIKKGEVASGTEIEAEFNKIFVVIGETSGSEGNLDDANFSPNAQISGTKSSNGTLTTVKIQDSSIPGSKIKSSVLITEAFATSAIPQGYVDTDTTADTLTTSTSFVDIPSIVAWTVTPGSTDNYLKLDLEVGTDGGSSSGRSYEFTFKVNGTDQAVVAVWTTSSSIDRFAWNVSLIVKAPTASSMTVIPRYRYSSGETSVGMTFKGPKVFRGIVIPVK